MNTPQYAFLIWYRVEREDDETERAIRGMMARLACRTRIRGRLLKKCGEPQLWLESYPEVEDPDAFHNRLKQAVDEYDIEMFIDGPRHTECFTDDSQVTPTCSATNG